MPVGTAQFGQADLSKAEAHTEAPMTQLGRAAGASQFGRADLSKTETHTEAAMTQLGRAAASCPIIDHVWFVKELSEPGTQRIEPTSSGLTDFCFSKYLCGKPFRTAAAIS